MSEPINDGGPAFPGEQGHTPSGSWNQTWEPGMTLRDWFAGTVPIAELGIGDYSVSGLMRFVGDTVPEPFTTPSVNEVTALVARAIAKARFMVADAMLAERAKAKP